MGGYTHFLYSKKNLQSACRTGIHGVGEGKSKNEDPYIGKKNSQI